MKIKYFILLFLGIILYSDYANALTICSQNLSRFGETKKKGESRKEQRAELVERMLNASCEIVALQEVYGEDEKEAERNIKDLASSYSSVLNKKVDYYLGKTKDPYIRNGFLVVNSDLEFLDLKDYLSVPLERLSALGPIGRFIRAPIALELRDRKSLKKYFVLNIHFKSKSFGFKDHSGYNFEPLRMEMAETTRDILFKEVRNSKEKTVFVVLGDRNADYNEASAEILSGKRELDDFVTNNCSLTSELVANCNNIEVRTEKVIPLFATKKRESLNSRELGSYLYKKKIELIDEIYILPEDLNLVKNKNKQFAIGVEGAFFKGSDHKLVWAEFYDQ